MIDLYEHNKTAYESAIAMLSEAGKAAIVHPTGTGKSFIGFKLCEDNADKTVCWLSPSEYIFKTQLENVKASCGYKPENIRFFTYAKLMLMSTEEIAAIKPDYILLDEFHRCGAEFWGQGVQNVLSSYPEVPVLGLSATTVRYLDNRRDMADELFDGNIASEMTLGESIVRGILNPPKYVLSVFSYQEDLERYRRRVRGTKNSTIRDTAEVYLEALRRALDKADGLDVIFDKHIEDRNGKYIAFCSGKEHMEEMASRAYDWFSKVDKEPHFYYAYSGDPETSKAFADFKADSSAHLKLLFCIDMLNEGIHVDDISGVILFRPTVSPIVYKQQIGRAMSAGKKQGTVIFDIVNNIGGLYSIGSVQEEIKEAVEAFRFNGESKTIVNDSFKVIDEVEDCIRLFDELENVLVASWDYMFLEAKQYYEENGNLSVPSKHITSGGYNLGAWLVTQRRVYNGSTEGVLTQEQIEKLNSIGMCWLKAHERIWEEQYANARAHYEKTGKLLPPFESNGLKAWIVSQRAKYRENTLKKDKVKRLDDIGMVWDLDEKWERMFELASGFYLENGNLDIPATYTVNGEKLGVWYRSCVSKYRKGILSEKQLARLKEIGFNCEGVYGRTWMRYYAEAEKYKNEHGDLAVPSDYVTKGNLKLGVWISGQRYSHGLGRLSKQRIELLDALGMDWQRFDARWMLGFSHLEAYVKELGNADVPCNYVCTDGFKLGNWTRAQRSRRLVGKLDKEKTEKMERLGFVWKILDTAWDDIFAVFADYRKRYGQECIPADYMTSHGTSLRAWLNNQRSKFIAGKLEAWKAEKLCSVDPNWNKPRDNWEANFECAQKYVKEHGPLSSVPTSYASDTGINLYSWLLAQRKSLKAGKLSPERLGKLISIGFSTATQKTPVRAAEGDAGRLGYVTVS